VVAQRLVILGTRSFAEEVADLAEQCAGVELAAFGENWERARCAEPLLGKPVVWVEDLAAMAGDHSAVCAIGTTRRRSYVERVRELGLRFMTLVHPSAILAPSALIGPGAIVGAGVIVAAQARVGAHVILNRGVLLGHHTTIGDYCTVSPGANVAGCVSIGEQSYIGIGATVLDHRSIGRDALVGAGALVTRNVPDRAHVQGIPARIVREDIDGH